MQNIGARKINRTGKRAIEFKCWHLIEKQERKNGYCLWPNKCRRRYKNVHICFATNQKKNPHTEKPLRENIKIDDQAFTKKKTVKTGKRCCDLTHVNVVALVVSRGSYREEVTEGKSVLHKLQEERPTRAAVWKEHCRKALL